MPKAIPPNKHSGHLKIEQKNAALQDLVAGKAEVFQARAAHDGEQDQVIHIHEITERADDDGGLEDFAQGGFVGFHPVNFTIYD